MLAVHSYDGEFMVNYNRAKFTADFLNGNL